MKLSQTQRDILGSCTLEAGLTVQEIAKRVRRKPHTISYALQRALSSGVFKKTWAVDISALGWSRYSIYFCCGIHDAREKGAAIKKILNTPGILHFVEVIGEYDFKLSFTARHVGDALSTIHTLSKSMPSFFLNKAISTRGGIYLFPTQYLTTKKAKVKRIIYGDTLNNYPIDDTDRAILDVRINNAGSSIQELSRLSGIPSTTIFERLKKLKEGGVIVQARYHGVSELYGSYYYILLVFTSGLDGASRDRLIQFAEEHPNCCSITECLGSWDFEIGVEVEAHEDLMKFREALFSNFQHFVVKVSALKRHRKYEFKRTVYQEPC